MKFLKGINLFVLITFFLSLVPVAPVFAMQTAGNATLGAQFESAATLLKDIYTLKYLDGDKGQHRDATFLGKATNSPDRALLTVAIYGLTFLLAKKFYDFAQKRGIFARIFDDLLNQPEQPARGRNPQPAVGQAPQMQPVPAEQPDLQVRPARRANGPRNNRRGRNARRDNRQHRPNNRRQVPNNQQRPAPQPAPEPAPQPAPQPHNVRIANPLPGQQLQQVLGLQRLRGFYHMHSVTPYQAVRNSCGINAAYNMGRIEGLVLGRQPTDARFDQVQRAVIPNLGAGGARSNELVDIAAQLNFAPVITLGIDVNQRIFFVGRFQGDPFGAANNAINARAAEFHRAQGPHVAHFFCNVPGHWIAVSVVRHADGTQAMYLYDNLNGAARSRNEMRQFVETIYNRFF